MQKDFSTPVSKRRRNKRTSNNKHSKYFQPQPQHSVPAVPTNWDGIAITGRVIETGQMVEGWFGQQVAETKTVFSITVDDIALAKDVDYDTAYAFIQKATAGYRADERRTPLSMLKNACAPGVVSGRYDTVTINKASEAYKKRVGGNLSFNYYLAGVAA